MKLMKRMIPQKGTFGYLKRKKSYDLTRTIVYFGVALTIFFSGLNLYDTKKNLFTILAVLAMLPAAKMAVQFIMTCRASKFACTDELHEQVEQADKTDSLEKAYDFYMTSYDKNYSVSCFAYGMGCLIGLTCSAKTDCNECVKHIEKYLSNDGIKGVAVKVFSDKDKFLQRLTEISDKNQNTTEDSEGIRVIELLENISV